MAAKGERIVITRDGRPLVMLVPFVNTQEKPCRKLGGMIGQFTLPADFDAPLPKDVMDEFERA